MKSETLNLSNFKANILQFECTNPTPCYGEDGVFKKIFDLIPSEGRPNVIEFGEHRVLGTTSRYLRIEKFARALYFSGDYGIKSRYLNFKDLIKISKHRGIRYLLFAINMPKKKVATVKNIVKIIQDFRKNEDIDLLVIDIDSIDYEIIFQILQNQIQPKVLVVEYNPNLKHSKLYLSSKNLSKITNPKQYGASYKSLVDLIQPFGYKLVHITGFCNLIFVRHQFSMLFETPDFTELTLDQDSIINYCDKWCLEGFRPSWLSAKDLTEDELSIFTNVE